MADIAASGFLSTPSARRATYVAVLLVQFHAISIHALREEGDSWISQNEDWLQISIHALREEGDMNRHSDTKRHGRFLSTPSARRATGGIGYMSLNPGDFYPRPPRGGRQYYYELIDYIDKISIHALREEGDCIRHDHTYQQGLISIHALREEGDHRDWQNDENRGISIHALREEGDAG